MINLSGLLSPAMNLFVDRGRLKVEAKMVTESSNRNSVELRVNAVNVGKRPLRIKRVVVLLGKSQLPLPQNLPLDAVAQIRNAESQVSLVEHTLCMVGGDGGSVEIGPDGHEFTWSARITNDVEFLSERKPRGEYGRGYVLFTSGKKHNFKFLVIRAHQWEETVKSMSS